MNIKEFYASKSNILLEAQIGIETEYGFTGIYIVEQNKYYIVNNKVQRSDYIDEILEENELFEEIHNFYYNNIQSIIDMDILKKENVKKTKIYLSYTNEEHYFSEQNSEIFPFKSRPECMKDYITPTNKKIRKLEKYLLNETLLKLEEFYLETEYTQNEKKIETLNKKLESFGFKRI